jgi:quinol monooxygenase YgiN
MEIYIFARFHARPGLEAAVEDALHAVVAASREEVGCVSIHSYRSIRDPQLCYIHSRWKDEAAFETHAGLPHTVQFVDRVKPLLDHPVEAQRCQVMN